MGYIQSVPRPRVRQRDLSKPFIWYDYACEVWRVTSRHYSASAVSFELAKRSLQAHIRGIDRFYVYKFGNSWVADRYNHAFESYVFPANRGGWTACMNRVRGRLREIASEKAQHALAAGTK